QSACIEIADDGDVVFGQESIGFFIAAPVAGQRRELAHYEPFDIRFRRFVIVTAGAVIPDLRICQNDNLAGIRRIGEYFLVAGEGRVENDLAGPLCRRTKTPAFEDRPVFQGEDCSWQFTWFLPGSG